MPKERGAITIYALITELKSGTAAYIGQTVSFERRMREHSRQREGKAATKLIQHAHAEGRTVRTIILEIAHGSDQADSAEGAWIWSAHQKGLNLIALDSWFQRKNSTRHLAAAKVWPDSVIIALKAKLLDEYSRKALENEKGRRKFLEELDD